jgi:hypothetical protein
MLLDRPVRHPAKHTPADSHPVAGHNSSAGQPHQLELVHEESLDLLKSLVAALGGAKQVGPRLYPTKTDEAAARAVYDRLDANRDHVFEFDEILTLLRWAREAGAHFGFYWICDQLLYSHPAPVNPEDARAEIQREFVRAVAHVEQLARRLGK